MSTYGLLGITDMTVFLGHCCVRLVVCGTGARTVGVCLEVGDIVVSLSF